MRGGEPQCRAWRKAQLTSCRGRTRGKEAALKEEEWSLCMTEGLSAPVKEASGLPNPAQERKVFKVSLN